MNNNRLDTNEADLEYKGFPSVSKWADIKIDKNRWSRNVGKLNTFRQVKSKSLEHAGKVIRRYAAIQTGAVEKLYNLEKGFSCP